MEPKTTTARRGAGLSCGGIGPSGRAQKMLNASLALSGRAPDWAVIV